MVRAVTDAGPAGRRTHHARGRRIDADLAKGHVRHVRRGHCGNRWRTGNGPMGRHHRQWRPDACRGSDCVRHARDVPHDCDLSQRAAGHAVDGHVPARDPERRSGDLRALPRCGNWRCRYGFGQRPDRAVPRPRDAVARAVRPRCFESPLGQVG